MGEYFIVSRVRGQLSPSPAGTYTLATVAVDAQGRVTSGSSGAAVASVQAPSGTALAQRSTLAFQAANFSGTDTGNASLVSLAATGSAGTFTSVTTDAWGRVAAGTLAPLVPQGWAFVSGTTGAVITGSNVTVFRSAPGLYTGSLTNGHSVTTVQATQLSQLDPILDIPVFVMPGLITGAQCYVRVLNRLGTVSDANFLLVFY